jgi:hypothetical protein
MTYINTITFAYPVYQAEIQSEFFNYSFTIPFVAPKPYEPVLNTPKPEYNQITQNAIEITPVHDDSEWVQQWQIIDLDPEQIAYNEEQARQANKSAAESLLSATDWIELGDVSNPVNPPWLTNKAEFTTYRAVLRQIAVYPPVKVDSWPVLPQTIWSST